jgi:DNA-binding transcriptional LysR family regulator
VRITAIDHVIDTVLWPRIAPLLPQYPDLHIEISSDYRLVDIAAERFDIGVRHGDQVEKDMIAVRLTADVPMRIVGAPAYFARRPAPVSLQDLMTHNCINLRLASSGGLYAWELLHDGQPIEARVRGQAVFTNVHHMLAAALDGVGVTFLPESLVAPHLAAGRLVSVMEDWCPSFPGLHAYYPSRRHSSRALGLVIDALRYAG